MEKRLKCIKMAVSLFVAAIFVFSAYKLIDYNLSARTSSDLNSLLIEKAVSVPSPPIINFEEIKKDNVSNDNAAEIVKESEPETEVELEISPISVDFETLKKENNDIVGWLYCADTPINYPVVQADDNEYYLRRLFNGDWNISGTLFMDYRNTFGNNDWNTVIYGHNMKNDSMFGTLTSYCEQTYYDQHPVLYFLTPDTDYKIELISGFVTPSTSALYNVYLSESERMPVVTDILNSSAFLSNAELSDDERLLTLSTCSNEYDSARYVVIGKMIRIE